MSLVITSIHIPIIITITMAMFIDVSTAVIITIINFYGNQGKPR